MLAVGNDEHGGGRAGAGGRTTVGSGGRAGDIVQACLMALMASL